MSLPVRGAWIEISIRFYCRFSFRSRSPCGERGLKYLPIRKKQCNPLSLPVRGAWIEIFTPCS